MPAPFPMPVTTASAPPARRTAVAPCRDRWTIASSIAVTTRAATRPASFELSCPSALQFNQLLQNPGRKGRTEVSGPDVNCPGTASGSTLFYFTSMAMHRSSTL